MERTTAILDECLRLVRWIRQARPGTILDATQLRSASRAALARMRAAGEERGLSPADTDDAAFAVVALIDEAVATHGGPLAQEWGREQLQLAMFGENTAGETFFVKLEQLRRDRTRVHVLAIYYLVLHLGLRGRYAVHGELALQELTESVRVDLERAGVLEELPLAPAGARPRQAAARRPDSWIVVAVGAAALALAGVLYGALLLDLTVRVHAVLGG